MNQLRARAFALEAPRKRNEIGTYQIKERLKLPRLKPPNGSSYFCTFHVRNCPNVGLLFLGRENNRKKTKELPKVEVVRKVEVRTMF
jgi:hypothetical protein